ncbi:MAG: uroporphyrinogen decarboxylase family protein [Vulcanimicrobiota bacterium]
MKKMNKDERINAVLKGEPTDRVAASFWRHFYQSEDSARGLADAMLLFQENYDWDFMKVNPRASYHYEDWGAEFQFFKDGLKKPRRLDYPVKKLSDLEKIHPLEPLKTKVLREQIDALHFIKKGLDKHTYFVMTVFTPLSIAGDMTETRDTFKEYMLEDPKLAKQAIEAVTVTFERFVSELLNVGVSGLFFATTHWGTRDRITKELFNEFSRPYDMRILNLVQECPLNILHVCKSNNMLEELKDYPVHAFNWDSMDSTNPDMGEGQEIVNRTVIGGIDQKETLFTGSVNKVIEEAEKARKETRRNQWILGAGCTISPSTPAPSLKALREWIEKAHVNA